MAKNCFFFLIFRDKKHFKTILLSGQKRVRLDKSAKFVLLAKIVMLFPIKFIN